MGCPPLARSRVNMLYVDHLLRVNSLSTSFSHYNNTGFKGFGGIIVCAWWYANLCPLQVVSVIFCVCVCLGVAK